MRPQRRMLALGSGDPTRAICSPLIAKAFQSIRYPILPEIKEPGTQRSDLPGLRSLRYCTRHHRLSSHGISAHTPIFKSPSPLPEDGFVYKLLTLGRRATRVSPMSATAILIPSLWWSIQRQKQETPSTLIARPEAWGHFFTRASAPFANALAVNRNDIMFFS